MGKRIIINESERDEIRKLYNLMESEGYPECVSNFPVQQWRNPDVEVAAQRPNQLNVSTWFGDTWTGYTKDGRIILAASDGKSNSEIGKYFCKGNKIVPQQRKDVTGGAKPGVTESDGFNWELVRNGEKLIKLGSRGPMVQALQGMLVEFNPFSWDETKLQKIGGPNCKNVSGYASCDGRFGPTTREAVMAYQNKFGMKPDGAVGQQFMQNWDAL